MRRTLFLLSLFVTVSAFGQHRPSKNAFTIFLSNPSFGWSEGGGSIAEGGAGVGFERQLTPRISAVVSAAWEQYHAFEGDRRFSYEVVPVNVVARYHFLTGRRVSPYLGLGGRYVNAPASVAAQRQFTLVANGGLMFRVGHRLDLFADYKRGLAEEGRQYDPQSKVSAGVRWRF